MRRWILLLCLTASWPLVADEPPPEVGRGFAHHVREALAINRSRRDAYAKLSAGRSVKASAQLIQGESLTLPFAWWFDRQARRFNDAGVGIVRDDFVALHDLPPPEAPIRYHGRATPSEKRTLKRLLDGYRDALATRVAADDFLGAAELTRVALGGVQALEREQRVHWAMTVHILEQVGLSAEHAQDHVAADPAAAQLARRFLRFLAFGLKSSPGLDHEAQRAHVLGVGVIVNDLPPIPFHVDPAPTPASDPEGAGETSQEGIVDGVPR